MRPSVAGRNDPCPCGSGRKFKKCCGADADPRSSAPSASELARAALNRMAADDLAVAETLARDALAMDRNQVDALNVLAIATCRRRNYRDALDFVQRALKRAPDSGQLHMNRGNILRESGDAAGAVESLRRAIVLDKTLEAAHFNLGLALVDMGDDGAAADAFERFLGTPTDSERLMELAQRLRHLSRFDAMAVVLRRAAQRSETDHRLQSDLAMALLELGRPDLAEEPIRRAVELAPDVALVHRNLATVLLEQGRLSEALASAHHSLGLDPSRHETLCLVAVVHAALRAPDEANAAFLRARTMAPDDALTALRHGMMLLATGDFTQGLPLLERRLDDSRILPWDRLDRMTRWRGEDLAGRSILLHAEQGHGDAIQFVRYASVLNRRGAQVHVVCHPGLARLFASVEGVASVSKLGAPLPDCDYFAPMMSLALAVGTTLATVPAQVPYVGAAQDATGAWATRFEDDGRRRVGLCWAGNPEYGTDRRRSIPAPLLRPLIDVEGLNLISLQKTPAGSSPTYPNAGLALTDWTHELEDFADTAALISTLDLVISVDTSVAHLAGALGRPVWLLNRFDTDWRWGWQGDHSPWYPTMRIFRQPVSGDWTSVIADVVEALAANSRT